MIERNRVVDFLNALPTTSKTLLWGNQFQNALLILFDDVSRISININMSCDIISPDEYQSRTIYTQHFTGNKDSQATVTAHTNHPDEPPSIRLINDFRQHGFPFATFHEPIGFDYYLGKTAYLGTLLFWKEKAEPPISRKTIEEIQSLESFILFALSDHIARQNTAQPFNEAFSDALAILGSEAGLSEQERKVVLLQLSGYTYDEIAEIMHLSKDTVRKHVGAIYRKSGVKSLAELFAKYFTPRHGL